MNNKAYNAIMKTIKGGYLTFVMMLSFWFISTSLRVDAKLAMNGVSSMSTVRRMISTGKVDIKTSRLVSRNWLLNVFMFSLYINEVIFDVEYL